MPGIYLHQHVPSTTTHGVDLTWHHLLPGNRSEDLDCLWSISIFPTENTCEVSCLSAWLELCTMNTKIQQWISIVGETEIHEQNTINIRRRFIVRSKRWPGHRWPATFLPDYICMPGIYLHQPIATLDYNNTRAIQEWMFHFQEGPPTTPDAFLLDYIGRKCGECSIEIQIQRITISQEI